MRGKKKHPKMWLSFKKSPISCVRCIEEIVKESGEEVRGMPTSDWSGECAE